MSSSFVAYVDESGDEGFRFLPQEQGSSRWFVLSALVIRNPGVFQQQAFALYHYATRLLVQRMSWLCRDYHREGHGNGMVEMIFSNRSAMSYEDLRGYLHKLRMGEPAAAARIDWHVVDPLRIRAVNHEQLAGLQLADAVASGVFYAVHRNPYGETEDRYLRLLARTIYRHQGHAEGYGLKFWCEDVQVVARVLQAVEEARAG